MNARIPKGRLFRGPSMSLRQEEKNAVDDMVVQATIQLPTASTTSYHRLPSSSINTPKISTTSIVDELVLEQRQ